jgi:hypothetical protein
MSTIIETGVRRQEKMLLVTGQTPTIPTVALSTDPGWLVTDIYEGEICVNQADGLMWTRLNGVIIGPFALRSDVPDSVVKTAKITLSPSDLAAFNNSAPIMLIAAPGAGKAIQVLSVSHRLNFNTTAYVASPAYLSAIDFSNYQMDLNSNFDALSSGLFMGFFPAATSSSSLAENAALNLVTGGGGPGATGDSSIDIYIAYRIIAL